MARATYVIINNVMTVADKMYTANKPLTAKYKNLPNVTVKKNIYAYVLDIIIKSNNK